MPGTPHIPYSLPLTYDEPREVERLPKARSELVELLQRLTIDVERMASTQGRSRQGSPIKRPEAIPHFHPSEVATYGLDLNAALPAVPDIPL
jgi:hypothetical protein